MAGSATFTIVASRTIISMPAHSTARASQRVSRVEALAGNAEDMSWGCSLGGQSEGDRSARDRPRGEERLINGVVNQVQPRLKTIDELVQPFFNDIIDIGEVELRAHEAELLLGGSLAGAARRPGNRPQRLLGVDQTEMHRARKRAVDFTG